MTTQFLPAQTKTAQQLAAECNVLVRAIHGVSDFYSDVARDNREAAQYGLTVINLYVDDTSREKDGKSIKLYPSKVRIPTVRRWRERGSVFGSLAGRIVKRMPDEDAVIALGKVRMQLLVVLKRLRDLDPKLFDQYKSQGKQHLAGVDVAVKGGARVGSQTHSDKHMADTPTEIRYSKDAPTWDRQDKATTAYLGRTYTVSEDALAAHVQEQRDMYEAGAR
jgi:hypothetical protein